MTTTSNFQLVLLDVGQKEKEVTINTNFEMLDNKVPRFLGKLASAPSSTGLAVGSYYYNTGTSKMQFLIDSTTWANA